MEFLQALFLVSQLLTIKTHEMKGLQNEEGERGILKVDDLPFPLYFSLFYMVHKNSAIPRSIAYCRSETTIL